MIAAQRPRTLPQLAALALAGQPVRLLALAGPTRRAAPVPLAISLQRIEIPILVLASVLQAASLIF